MVGTSMSDEGDGSSSSASISAEVDGASSSASSWDEGDVASSTLSQKRKRSSISSGDGGKKLSTTVLDLNILDCPICYETLTTPIFQCDNGHLACSSCCPKLSNKCPACTSSIGHIRCRAMESVLESVFVPCPNAKLGCTENIPYGKQLTHDKECNFSPCSCPVHDCDYTGTYKELYYHYGSSTHQKTESSCLQPHRQPTRFSSCISFSIKMNMSDKILIQRKYIESLLFALQCFKEPCGVYVTVSCIAPSSPEVGEFSYYISYTTEDGYTTNFKSPKVKSVLEVSFQTPENNFMLIHDSLLRGDLLNLKLCINKFN